MCLIKKTPHRLKFRFFSRPKTSRGYITCRPPMVIYWFRFSLNRDHLCKFKPVDHSLGVKIIPIIISSLCCGLFTALFPADQILKTQGEYIHVISRCFIHIIFHTRQKQFPSTRYSLGITYIHDMSLWLGFIFRQLDFTRILNWAT